MSRPSRAFRRPPLRGLFLGVISVCALAAPVHAQDLWSLAKKALGERASGAPATRAAYTASDADAALRQALTLGAEAVGARLSAQNGFWGDQTVRIPLPGSLEKVRSGLKPLGLTGPLDDLQLRMNRAAEDAAGEVAPLVVEAVRTMTLDDAIGIVRGGDGAGSAYLRQRTEPALRTKFTPIVRTALADAGAMSALSSATRRYKVSGLATDAEASLTDFVVTRALDAVFVKLAAEEAAVRSDPVKQTSAVLKRVFGS